ncbi:MAG: SUMF1/EgtB/PvdO family nonheme iron enzyme [Isosphaeraceae bacterium]
MARLTFATLALAVVFGAVVLSPGRDSRGVETREKPVNPGTVQAQGPKDDVAAHPEFKAAGVCARCHVVQVLEWGISGHVAASTTCRDCHGPSAPHVANERNEVKPDTLPRGDQIASACLGCHKAGCPETSQTVSCQKCHHPHALLNPNKSPKPDEGPFAESLRRWQAFRRHVDEGEKQMRRNDWNAAKRAFQEALTLRPGDRETGERLTLCLRRLNPAVPGFTVVGESYDPRTGLPKEVSVAGLDLSMVLIPAGEFDMGSDRLPDAKPVHTVALGAFYLGKQEVTQAQWQAVMGSNPSVHQGPTFADSGRLPVESVSWQDCQRFIRSLNARVAGGGFRLPTEAEWEYACRAGAGDTSADEALGTLAWFRENSRREAGGGGGPQSPAAWSPRPVGTKRANSWGLFDMRGNVSEWCSSLYQPYPYDPAGGRESLEAAGTRVVRGGGFADSADGLDPALRHFDRPNRRYRWNGLRLARDVPRGPSATPAVSPPSR